MKYVCMRVSYLQDNMMQYRLSEEAGAQYTQFYDSVEDLLKDINAAERKNVGHICNNQVKNWKAYDVTHKP